MTGRALTPLLWIAVACRDPQPPERLLEITSPAALDDVVWAGDATWFVLGDDHRERPSTLCRLASRTLNCATIPGRARLVEGAHPLVAISDGDATKYVEPFTWKLVHRVEHVHFDQHAIVTSDRTLWIEERGNLLVVTGTGHSSRWFQRDVSKVAISPAGALWIEYRGADPATQTAVLTSAVFEAGRLVRPREREGIEQWAIGRGADLCQVGNTVGVIELHRRDLVRFELDSDRVARVHVGENASIQCGIGAVAATPVKFTDGPSPVAWCDRAGCREAFADLEERHFGAFTVLDDRVFAVGSTSRDRLVAWKVGEQPQFYPVPANNTLSLASAAPLPDGGALVQFIYGESFVFERDGRPRPLELMWFDRSIP